MFYKYHICLHVFWSMFEACLKYVWNMLRAHFSLFRHVKPWPPGSRLSAEAQESTVYLVTMSDRATQLRSCAPRRICMTLNTCPGKIRRRVHPRGRQHSQRPRRTPQRTRLRSPCRRIRKRSSAKNTRENTWKHVKTRETFEKHTSNILEITCKHILKHTFNWLSYFHFRCHIKCIISYEGMISYIPS